MRAEDVFIPGSETIAVDIGVDVVREWKCAVVNLPVVGDVVGIAIGVGWYHQGGIRATADVAEDCLVVCRRRERSDVHCKTSLNWATT